MVASSRERERKTLIEACVLLEGTALYEAVIQKHDGELRFLAAAMLYEQRELSWGKAARLCGVKRIDFMDRLSAANFSPLNSTVEQLEAEQERNR